MPASLEQLAGRKSRRFSPVGMAAGESHLRVFADAAPKILHVSTSSARTADTGAQRESWGQAWSPRDPRFA